MDLWGSWLLQNDFKNTLREIRSCLLELAWSQRGRGQRQLRAQLSQHPRELATLDLCLVVGVWYLVFGVWGLSPTLSTPVRTCDS